MPGVNKSAERALLVGVVMPGDHGHDAADSLDELAQLTLTAGGTIRHTVTCTLREVHPATLIGAGKIKEIGGMCRDHDIDLIVVDEELAPAQQRNLEKELETRVLDRTGLILDIFAMRARSHEGKLQVELAQLEYLLPRLAGMWRHLSRLGGGIGTRGPGETQLEVDRRLIRKRIQAVKMSLSRVKHRRIENRKRRQRQQVAAISMVGYTNAGKSLLLNRLTSAETFVEDQLFATLDPLTRRLALPSGRIVLITDTVGFIRKLPHQLVSAFRATLEEVVESDLLLHVIDSSHPRMEQHMEAVRGVLEELGAGAKPVVWAYNKIDLADDPAALAASLQRRTPGATAVSALRGDGLEELMRSLDHALESTIASLRLKVKYGAEALLGEIRALGEIQEYEYQEDGIAVTVRCPRNQVDRLVAMATGGLIMRI
ncbi:GTPase HflX [bacterium]|nr:GTPase HflX [candidate division CSSED10-310 bacterium]